MQAITNIFGNIFGFLFKSRTRIIIFLIILGILGYSGWKVLGQKSAAPQYQTSQAQKGTLITSVTASGTVAAGNSVSITTQASGVITDVYVKNGDAVTQGEKIADIQPDQGSQARLASSYASYVSSSNSLQTAQNNQHTAQISLEKALDDIHLFQYGNGGFPNVGSPNETEAQKQSRTQAEEAKNNADNSVNTAQAQANSAWLSYQQNSATVVAPISGVISNLTATTGLALVSTTSSNSNSTSTTSQSLGNVTLSQAQVQATVNLSEIDVVNVQPGQKVTLTLDAFPDKTFAGKIITINTNGSVSSGVTTYPAIIGFDTAVDNIYPNMAVNAVIITKIKNDVILVPSAAVTTTNGVSTVRVLKNGQVSPVTVTTGDSNDTQTEITSGINEGDMVVTGQTATTRSSGTTTTSPFGGGLRFGGGGGFGGGAGGAARGGGRGG
jgi:membrane fusion protein, macrolide-specific efflux system